MKIRNFDNIEPMPNPKPLSVERVTVCSITEDENGDIKYGPKSVGFIRNAKLSPDALTGRW